MKPWTPDEGCSKSCLGAAVYFDPHTGEPVYEQHWHLTCWLCGEPVIGYAQRSYCCAPCDFTEGPPVGARYETGYEGPEFAATHSSPA